MTMTISNSATYHDKIQFNGQGQASAYVDSRESIAAIAKDTSLSPDRVAQLQQEKLDSLSSDHLLNMATRPFGPNTTDEEKKVAQMAAQTLLDRGHTSFNGVDDTAGLQSIADGNAPTAADQKFNRDNKNQLNDKLNAALSSDPSKDPASAAAWLLDQHADYFSNDMLSQLTAIAGRSNQVGP